MFRTFSEPVITGVPTPFSPRQLRVFEQVGGGMGEALFFISQDMSLMDLT